MGRPLVDTFITEVSQDTWIYFPWDTGLAFPPPIREGGRLTARRNWGNIAQNDREEAHERQAEPRMQRRSTDLRSHHLKPAEMPWQKQRFPGCEIKPLLFDAEERARDHAGADAAGRGAARP